MFGEFHLERSLLSLLALTDPDILKKSKFTDHEQNMMKNLPLEKMRRQLIFKENVAVSLTEQGFLFFEEWPFQI